MSVSPSRLSLSSPSEAAAVALALGGFTARPSKYTPKKYLRNSPLFASLATSSATKKPTPKRKRDSPTELDALSLSSAEAPLSPTLSASSGDADSSVTLSDLEAAEFLVTFKRQCGSPTNSTLSGSSAAESPSRRAKAPSPLEWSLDAPSASASLSAVSVEFAVPHQYSSARGQLLRFQQVASRMYQRKLDQLIAPAPASPVDSDMASTDSIAEGL